MTDDARPKSEKFKEIARAAEPDMSESALKAMGGEIRSRGPAAVGPSST